MSSRKSIQQVVSPTEPVGGSLGDEWLNPTTGVLRKLTVVNGIPQYVTVLTNLSTITASSATAASTPITINNKTAAYTVVAADANSIINCSGVTSFTVSLTAAATLGSGFNCVIWNTTTTASMAVTIDPNGAETIDGRTTIILRRGEGTQIICDGTNWETGNKKTMRLYSENNYPSSNRSSASGDGSFAIGLNATASGESSFALGVSANATALNSVAIGTNSSSQGSQAVTGLGAMALGGSYASGIDSFAAAISTNSSTYGAKGSNSVAIGNLSLASGSFSCALTNSASASANSAVAIGRFAVASGADSVSIGARGNATGSASICLSTDDGGYGGGASRPYSVAVGLAANSAIDGKYAYSAGVFSAAGDAQTGTFVLRRATTDATATVITTTNSAAVSTNQIILPNNSAFAFTGTVVARRQAAGGTESAAWQVTGLIRREGTAASTVLVNSALTVISNVPGWTLALSADTTNGGLAVTATGAAATNIRWVATMQTSEVTYA